MIWVNLALGYLGQFRLSLHDTLKDHGGNMRAIRMLYDLGKNH